MYFISAPFGNYLHFKNATSVHGTFTTNPRKGRFSQILKTLRYVKTDAGWAWRNKLGLRNPGIKTGMLKTDYNSVLSIAALEPKDWTFFKLMLSPNRNIELNVSCPNLDTHDDTTAWDDFDKFPEHMRGDWCIVKVPPTASEELIDRIVDKGYTQIHASNTLQTEKGGLSGKILVPHTLGIISLLKRKYPHVQVIAGGGVSSPEDADKYLEEGADHISLGSVCFTPWKVRKIINR